MVEFKKGSDEEERKDPERRKRVLEEGRHAVAPAGDRHLVTLSEDETSRDVVGGAQSQLGAVAKTIVERRRASARPSLEGARLGAEIRGARELE